MTLSGAARRNQSRFAAAIFPQVIHCRLFSWVRYELVDSLFGSRATDPAARPFGSRPNSLSPYASVIVAAFCVVEARSFRLAGALCLGLAPGLGGCLLGTEKPDAALDVPPRYRMAPHDQDAALPSVIWWRGFRDKQLIDLIEEALTSNLDIAAAVARILQADAQSRIAGAPLVPAIDFNASASRSRASQTTGPGGVQQQRSGRAHPIQHVAERELRDRLLGQEPRGAARRRGDCGGEPLRPRGGGADHGRLGRERLFPGAVGA